MSDTPFIDAAIQADIACRQATGSQWHITATLAAARRLERTLRDVQAIASGEQQVADDDTEGMAVIQQRIAEELGEPCHAEGGVSTKEG